MKKRHPEMEEQSASKFEKLFSKKKSDMKHMKFYGEEESDLEENVETRPFSKEHIQKELEKEYDRKREKKISSTYLEREQIEGEEIYSNNEEDDNQAIKIEPFHLSRELEEGSFDKEGMYIYEKDEEEVLDNWLQDISKKEIRKASEAHERRKGQQKKIEIEEDRNQFNQLSHQKIYQNLLEYMTSFHTKTIVQTLKQLAKLENKEPFNIVTELADQLCTSGVYDIYECTEKIIEARCHKDKVSSEPITWEYRRDNESQEIYGPFHTELMIQWQNEGYFPDTLLVRKIEQGKSEQFRLLKDIPEFSSFLRK
jgi:hypothetical protein